MPKTDDHLLALRHRIDDLAGACLCCDRVTDELPTLMLDSICCWIWFGFLS